MQPDLGQNITQTPMDLCSHLKPCQRGLHSLHSLLPSPVFQAPTRMANQDFRDLLPKVPNSSTFLLKPFPKLKNYNPIPGINFLYSLFVSLFPQYTCIQKTLKAVCLTYHCYDKKYPTKSNLGKERVCFE